MILKKTEEKDLFFSKHQSQSTYQTNKLQRPTQQGTHKESYPNLIYQQGDISTTRESRTKDLKR